MNKYIQINKCDLITHLNKTSKIILNSLFSLIKETQTQDIWIHLFKPQLCYFGYGIIVTICDDKIYLLIPSGNYEYQHDEIIILSNIILNLINVQDTNVYLMYSDYIEYPSE